jgi:hypothetical protein
MNATNPMNARKAIIAILQAQSLSFDQMNAINPKNTLNPDRPNDQIDQ